MSNEKDTSERIYREQELNDLRTKGLAKNQRQRFEDGSGHSREKYLSRHLDKMNAPSPSESRDDDFNWDYALVAADSSVSVESSEFNGPIIYTYQSKKPNALSPTSTVSSFTATEYESTISRASDERDQVVTPTRDKSKLIPEQLLRITEEAYEEEIIFENSFASPRSRQSTYKTLAFTMSPRTRMNNGGLLPTAEESRFNFDNVPPEVKSTGSSSNLLSPSKKASDDITPPDKPSTDSAPTPEKAKVKSILGLYWCRPRVRPSNKIPNDNARNGQNHLSISKGNEDLSTHPSDSQETASQKHVEYHTTSLVWIALLASLLGAAGIVLLTVALPRETGTKATSTSTTEENRAESLLGVASSISGYKVLDNRESPQYKAYDWLLSKDGGNVSLLKTSYDVLVERYVISVLYFAAEGEGWREQHEFMTPDSVCTWHANQTDGTQFGIECDDNFNVYAIRLADNNLVGTIPSEIVYLNELQVLSLSGNDLGGELFSALGLMDSLVEINLLSNSIDGTIPSEIGRLSNLKNLDLSSNHLTGEIPSEVGRLGNLERLGLGDNNLEGSLPASIASMTNLVALSLFRNNITGTVPTTIGQLDNLDMLNLASNHFHGDLGEVFCPEGREYATFWADCKGEPALVTCSCCSICCEKNENNGLVCT